MGGLPAASQVGLMKGHIGASVCVSPLGLALAQVAVWVFSLK